MATYSQSTTKYMYLAGHLRATFRGNLIQNKSPSKSTCRTEGNPEKLGLAPPLTLTEGGVLTTWLAIPPPPRALFLSFISSKFPHNSAKTSKTIFHGGAQASSREVEGLETVGEGRYTSPSKPLVMPCESSRPELSRQVELFPVLEESFLEVPLPLCCP
ncbi:hypothetical protein E2C01_056449 [Portunus trituberculatus]|uniref:Uncharacterized protein n=1 Tax=Portunus trituberculatus TaxID=210409 RepID=A0A5B7GY75_PORTR|nr:hypothetical protein [Portunus trituberculatus]